jgi:hypothetical protein
MSRWAKHVSICSLQVVGRHTICRFQLFDPGTSLVLHFQQIMQVLAQYGHTPPESDVWASARPAQKVGSRT